MLQIPAFCDTCGTIFASGFEVDNSRNIGFESCGASPCPQCGGMGHVPDGIYDAIENTLTLLSGPQKSIAEFGRLISELQRVRRQRANFEQVSEVLEEQGLSSLRDILPQKRAELYAVLGLLIAAAGVLVTQCADLPGDTVKINQQISIDVSIEEVIEKALKTDQTEQESEPSKQDK